MNFWIKNSIALLLGLGSCAGSYYIGKSSFHKVANWESVMATISSSNNVLRTATFTYNGTSYTIEVGNGMSKKDESRTKTVIFPKEDPSKGEVKNYKSMFMVPLVLAVFGLALIAVAFFSFRHKLSGRADVDPNSPEIRAQKEEMKQKALEMKQKIEDIKNKVNL